MLLQKTYKEVNLGMAKQKIRIRLKAFDHQLLDQSAEKIVETAKAALEKAAA